MKESLIFFSVMTVLLCTYSIIGTADEKPVDLKAIISDLDHKEADFTAQVNILFKTPQESVQLLINELRIIPITGFAAKEKGKHQSAYHVIQCIRALRSITGGLDFHALTNYRFEKNESIRKSQLFAGSRDSRTLPFFTFWKSQDYFFIAPADVQNDVIIQWRNWFNEKGSTYNYVNVIDDPRKGAK
jgi:hypothetical protein